MRCGIYVLLMVLFVGCQEQKPAETTEKKAPSTKPKSTEVSPRLVIHGGAGTILRENIPTERRKAYEEKLSDALSEGKAILDEGGTSTEAVIAAIQVMEDSPLFNAGVGAVLTHEETISHDASIMDGATNQAGAVAGIQTVKNPILAAYLVSVNSEHVLLSGKGAERFAEEQQLEPVSPEYFITDRRLRQLREIEKQNHAAVDPFINDQKYGTVGAVALDKAGNIAAGTSTGGMTNKKYGRIGDSPIIGAGTYADNATCGVSSTGHGEYFIRNVIAYDVAARIKYQQFNLRKAGDSAIANLTKKGGTGGIITLDRSGNIHMPFNTAGMFRGYYTDTSGIVVKMFGE